MSSSDVKKVYEIRDGSEVLGQFSVKSKAMAFKKECSVEGRKVKVFVRFIKDSERKPEPKKVVKTVPKDVPKPAPKKPVPKKTSGKAPGNPEAVPKPTPEYTEATVSGRTLKSSGKGVGPPTRLKRFIRLTIDGGGEDDVKSRDHNRD